MDAPSFILCALVLVLPRTFTAEPTTAVAPAVQRWQLGQEALRNGQPDEAIALYRESLKLDAELGRNYLSLAAAYSAKGDDDRAVENLALYLKTQPDHVAVRAHFAEMLLRLQRAEAARLQFERCVGDFQQHPEITGDKLIHCHSRLMELAAAVDDEYGEHLHRGIGFYLLARQTALLPNLEGDLAVQGLLFRAAGELSAARGERPDEARPCWYLHLVWSCLAQQQLANRCLHTARDAAPWSDLTATERYDLHAACHRSAVAQARK